MKVSAITNYQNQPKTINHRTRTNQNPVQPSFQSGKGAFWGSIIAAAYGVAVVAISATGVGAPIGAGMLALTAGGYGLAGAAVGDSITNNDKNNNSNNDHSHLHVH